MREGKRRGGEGRVKGRRVRGRGQEGEQKGRGRGGEIEGSGMECCVWRWITHTCSNGMHSVGDGTAVGTEHKHGAMVHSMHSECVRQEDPSSASLT